MKIINSFWYSSVMWFIRNIIKFRKELYDYRPWDYTYSLEMFKKGLTLTEKCMKSNTFEGSQQWESSEDLKRFLTELDKIIKGNWISLAEEELELTYPKITWRKVPNKPFYELCAPNEKDEEISKKIRERARYLEEKSKERFFSLLKGETDDKGLFTWWD